MKQNVYTLGDLNKHLPLKKKLVITHQIIKQTLPFVERVAITLYDPKTRYLKTFINSDDSDDPFDNYQSLIDDSPSLKHIVESGLPRIINKPITIEENAREHTKRIGRSGFAASYTIPMFNKGDFLGFIFFNSIDSDAFTDLTINHIDIFGHIIALMIINELSNINTLTAALKTTTKMAFMRDPETGSHLGRMSRYSRLIAFELADELGLEDDYIEYIFMFAPLHDIGKIAIPDNILLKAGRLNDEEMEIMKTHSVKGRIIVDEILSNFGLESIDHKDILRNIVEFHHEAINGTGYPSGLTGKDIPLEARIVAVADIFDALTSTRPYKPAWTNEDAYQLLHKMAGIKLDQKCVNALFANNDEIISIQQQFEEKLYG